MTRYIYLVEGEDWLKQFEKRKRFKFRPWHLFVMGFVVAASLAGLMWYLGVL
jgi:hypothetical protein